MTEATAAARPPVFTKELRVWLSPAQDAYLDDEVRRRKSEGKTSDDPAAAGGNRHVNKGMLIREALEAHFGITS
jgi:hypothetical protein